MTAALVSVCLLFTPNVAPKEPAWHTNAAPTPAVSVATPTMQYPITTATDSFVTMTEPAVIESYTIVASEVAVSPTTTTSTPTDPPPSSPLTLRERALNRLAELGAPQWVLNAFDCVGWFESRWSNVRSRTGDTGVLQINDVHRPELYRLGLDPWSPEDSASFAWLLFTRAGWSFRDWTTRGLCGLR